MRSDHRHLTAYQIGCEVGQYVVLVLRPAILDYNILALDIAGFAYALAECGQITCTISKPRAAEKSNHRHRWLLRPRRERPCCHAAKQCDEVAAFHYSITSSARASSNGGMCSPSCLAVLTLMTSSNLVGAWTGSSVGFSPLSTRLTYAAACRNKLSRLTP